MGRWSTRPWFIFVLLSSFLLVFSMFSQLASTRTFAAPSYAMTLSAADGGVDEREGQIQVFEARVRELLSKGVLPIIDVEHHWGDVIPIADLVTKMDRNDVALTWLGQNENGRP